MALPDERDACQLHMKVVYNVWYSTSMNRALKIAVASRTGSTMSSATESLELSAFEQAK